MARVLLTGGTGGLGSELVPRLMAAGYAVRIMSRRPRPATADAAVEWAQADLRDGSGLAEAVAGAEIIVHAGTSPFRQSRQVEVGGTRRLLEQAAAAGTSHVLYISIVGVDRIPFPYYRDKLAAEGVLEQGSVPWSILRATQFHSLIDRFLRALVRLPVALLPSDLRFQPIDTGEVAQRMVEAVGAGPGRAPAGHRRAGGADVSGAGPRLAQGPRSSRLDHPPAATGQDRRRIPASLQLYTRKRLRPDHLGPVAGGTLLVTRRVAGRLRTPEVQS